MQRAKSWKLVEALRWAKNAWMGETYKGIKHVLVLLSVERSALAGMPPHSHNRLSKPSKDSSNSKIANFDQVQYLSFCVGLLGVANAAEQRQFMKFSE
jgi:hypothetical protein